MIGDLIYSIGEQGPMTAGQTYRKSAEDLAWEIVFFGGRVDGDGELAQRFRDAHSGIIARARVQSARDQAVRAAAPSS